MRKEIACPNYLTIGLGLWLLISFNGLVTTVNQGHMALKEIRKEIAYPNNLPIRPWFLLYSITMAL